MKTPPDSSTKKTIHELAKEFPEKTYRELEKYRDADRQEEAADIPLTESQKSQDKLEPIGIGHNQPPDEGEEQDNPELFKTEIDYHRYWKDMYEKEHKLRQEAEGETTIVKGIGQNSPEMKTLKSEVEALKQQLHTDREKYKKENNDLHNKVADLTEATKSKDYFEKPDYKFLIDENHRLEQQYLEVMADNKKLAVEIEDRVNQMRKSGL